MTEPACVAQHAVRRADVQAGQYVVIFGAGPIGIMAARWVKLFGATPLLVDIAQDKVEFAIEKGLDAINSRTTNVSEEIRNRNHGKLADAAIQMTTKNGVGSTPNWTESDRANGKANAAAALFVISSVNKLVIINKTASNTCGP